MMSLGSRWTRRAAPGASAAGAPPAVPPCCGATTVPSGDGDNAWLARGGTEERRRVGVRVGVPGWVQRGAPGLFTPSCPSGSSRVAGPCPLDSWPLQEGSGAGTSAPPRFIIEFNLQSSLHATVPVTSAEAAFMCK